MPTHKGLRCTFHNKDGPLQEYQNNKSRSSRFSPGAVYIPAESRSPFWIECEALPDYPFTADVDKIGFTFYLDGKCIGGCSRIVNKGGPKEILEGVFSRNTLGRTFVHPFQFSHVSPVPESDQDEPVEENSSAGIGGIIIYVRRVKWLGEVKRTFRSPESVQKSFAKAVSEADLKGTDVTHIVRLGPQLPRPQAQYSSWRASDTITNPYARFHIFYRSPQVIQRLGLVPCTPLPPLSVADKIGLGSSREIVVYRLPSNAVVQAVAGLREQLDSLEKCLKVERETKRETYDEGMRGSQKRRKISWGGKSRVIDLTELD